MTETTTTVKKRRARRGSLQITETSVHQAADLLVSEGKEPTLDLVREKLGGGSYTPISEYLNTWRAERRPVLSIVDVDLPDDLGKFGQEFTKAMWAKSNNLASEKIKTAEDTANDRIRQAQVDREALEKEIVALESELDERDDTIEELTEELRKEKKDHHALLVTYQGLAKESEGYEKQIEDHKATIARMEKEHVAAIERMEKSHKDSIAQYQDTIAKIERDFDIAQKAHSEDIERLEGEIQQWQAKASASDKVAANTAAELSHEKKNNRASQEELDKLKGELLKSQTEAARQEGIVSEQNRLVELLSRNVDDSKEEAKKWELEVASVRGEKKAIEAKYEAMSDIKDQYAKAQALLDERTTALEKLEKRLDEEAKKRQATERELNSLKSK